MWMALVHYKRRQYVKSSALCEALLREQPKDQAALFLQCRARSSQHAVYETELEQEGVGDLMLDDNAISSKPRPGTSTARPNTSAAGRPGTGADRPTTGYARPGTASRPLTGKADVATALGRRSTGTASTARPITSLGRELRLGTASGAAQALEGLFSRQGRVEATKLARNASMAKVACDYLICCERNPTGALELCTEALEGDRAPRGPSWWWRYRQGTCYYQLGLYRDAERALAASIADQRMVSSVLQLAKVYLRMDQPTAALKVLQDALEDLPENVRLELWVARVHEFVQAHDTSIEAYKRVVALDASHVEGLACLATSYFYAGYPELGLRYFRRLLQMGCCAGPELWNNVGLSCFYSAQFDMALACFGRALAAADDRADIWYNISHVGIGLADLDLAKHALAVALALDPNHAESLNNLGVLHARDNNGSAAITAFVAAQKTAPDLFHPFFNHALVARTTGNLKDAFAKASTAVAINDRHADSTRLRDAIYSSFRVT